MPLQRGRHTTSAVKSARRCAPLFANEEASPHAARGLPAPPSCCSATAIRGGAGARSPCNAQILLESPVLRKLYPHAAADLLSGGEPPWTYVFVLAAARSTAADFPGVAGWRELDVAFFNASQHEVLTVASAHWRRRRVPDAQRRGRCARTTAAVPGRLRRRARADLDEALRILERVGTRDARCCSATSILATSRTSSADELKALRVRRAGATRGPGELTAGTQLFCNRRNSLNKLCGADCADAGAFALPSARLDHAAPPRPRARARGGAHQRRAHRAREPCSGGRRPRRAGRSLASPLWRELQGARSTAGGRRKTP